MRRTQAAQVDAPGGDYNLEIMTCRVCGKAGITIVGLGSNDNGAIELLYCTPGCARTQGWPWIVGERQPKSRPGQSDLFEVRP